MIISFIISEKVQTSLYSIVLMTVNDSLVISVQAESLILEALRMPNSFVEDMVIEPCRIPP